MTRDLNPAAPIISTLCDGSSGSRASEQRIVLAFYRAYKLWQRHQLTLPQTDPAPPTTAHFASAIASLHEAGQHL